MSRKRPEFAEDVYGGGAKSDATGGAVGRSTVTVSGGSYSNPSSWSLNPSTSPSSSLSSTSAPSSTTSIADSGRANSALSWSHDSSKFEPSGDSSSKYDLDSNKSLPLVGELDFQYADCDRYDVELAELYTYSEMEDFLQNFEEFCMYLLRFKHENTERWVEWTAAGKSRLIQDIMHGLDSADTNVRLDAARLLLYLLQGTYGDYTEEDEDEDHDEGDKKPSSASVDGSELFSKSTGEKPTKNDENEPLDGFFHKISQRLKKAEAGRVDALTPPEVDGGVGKDCGTGGHEQHCLLNAAVNAYFVYESGVYQSLCSMLACEREETSRRRLAKQHSVSSLNSSVGGASLASGHSSGVGSHRRSATLADNESLRVVINCLYHMVEAIRRPELVEQVANFCRTLADRRPRASAPYRAYTVERLTALRNSFLAELDEPLDTPKVPLVMFLFDMMPDFVRGKSPHFPIKKILLLTWKILLATLGGVEALRDGKARKRRAAGLSVVEDTLEVAARLKPVHYGGDNDSDVFISRLSRIGLRNSKVVSMECGKVRFLNRQTACASSSTGDGQKSQDDDDEPPRSGAEPSTASADEDADDAFRNDDDGVTTDSADDGGEPRRKSSGLNTQMTPKADTNRSPDDFNHAKFADVQQPPIVGAAADSANSRQARCERELELKIQQMLARPPKGTAFPRRLSRSSVSSASSTTGGDQTPRAGSPEPGATVDAPSLPWCAKVREKDIELFLEKAREKYFGYTLPGDSNTIFALPSPVIQSVNAFRRNVYVSLGDLEASADVRYNRFRFSQKEVIEETKTERLYQRMVPNMTEYVITLLKVILASLPSSKMKSDAVTILSDVLTPETDTNEMLSSSMSFELSGKNVLEEAVRFAIDVNRHKELIVKSSSAIIIILLKFFRLNHVYQFESLAQNLVLANCLPLVLKFIDQNMVRYIKSKHELTPFNYPQCALHYVRNDGEWPVLNADNVFVGEQDERAYYLWRNVFSSVNLLRVLNKLTKGKHARTMMLVVFKSAPVLKRCMPIRVGIFQLYVLKLLKMQARYLGRQWRKSNMNIISSIYMKVRHRFNDDWAFANETRTKAWDFQTEENNIGLLIKRFNLRRYGHLLGDIGYSANTNAKEQGAAVANSNGSRGRPPLSTTRTTPAAKKTSVSGAPRAAAAAFDTADTDDFEVRGGGDEETDGVAADAAFDDGSLRLDGIEPHDFQPYDNDLQSVLSWRPQFSERFKRNWRKWLRDEVLDNAVDWDFLLESTGVIAFGDRFDRPVEPGRNAAAVENIADDLIFVKS